MNVDPAEQTRWIAEHTGLDPTVVDTVLSVGVEYLASIGIAEAPDDYQFRYYGGPDPNMVWNSNLADMRVPAADCPRLVGIDEVVAMKVFDSEVEFFKAVGLIDARRPR